MIPDIRKIIQEIITSEALDTSAGKEWDYAKASGLAHFDDDEEAEE